MLEWTVHLMRREPGRAVVVYFTAGAAFALGVLLFQSLLFGLIGALLILSSTAEFLLPIRHSLTDRRACASYGLARLELPWSGVRRVLRGGGGLRLSPLAAPSRLDAFRGVGLRFAPDGEPGCRADVERILAERLPEQTEGGAA